jgi:hypothetical protein
MEKRFQTDFKGEARLVTNLTNRGDEDGAVSRAGGRQLEFLQEAQLQERQEIKLSGGFS